MIFPINGTGNLLFNIITSSGTQTAWVNQITQTGATTTAFNTFVPPTTVQITGPVSWDVDNPDDLQWTPGRGTHLVIPDGTERQIKLPDDTVIRVEKNGSFTIEDRDAKVVYRANRVRDFNSYVNASDKLEEFIKFCGEAGVRRGEVLSIPINLFIAWLVIEAANADNEQAPDVPLLPGITRITKPRCRCGRFLARKKASNGINHCRVTCFEAALLEAA